MSGGKSSPDTSAADAEAKDLQQEYDQNQQEIKEKRDQLDATEMGILHSQGGITDEAPPAPVPTLTKIDSNAIFDSGGSGGGKGDFGGTIP